MHQADQIPVTLIAFKHQFERTPVVSGHLFVQTGKVILHKTSLRIGGGHIFQRVSLHQNGVYRRLRGGSIVGIEDVALKILPSGQFNGGAGAVLNTPHIRDVVLGQEDELGGEEIAVTTGLHRGVRRQGNPFLRVHQRGQGLIIALLQRGENLSGTVGQAGGAGVGRRGLVEGRSTLYQAAPADAGTSCLSDRAGQVLAALKESDYEALAALVHPEKGVTLTPYSTVEPSCDRNLLPAQLVLLPEDDIPYVWGIEDGTGAPIELTGREYFERYVFNADYTAAPETAVDTVLMQGNALENVASAYPEGRFVEYHFPGLDEQMAGYDWCSLKLVFECYQGDWYLVGLVHSEWTV